MKIKFYNTLTRSKEEFKPIDEKVVKIYSCGPTVYSTQHIGNMRAMIFVDILKNVLRYFNFKILDVINITDVGHLVSDSDDGEDKMLKASKKEKKDPYEIARIYENFFIEDLKKLNITLPKYLPRATDHIKEQIQIIKELEKKDIAYKTNDGMYFDISKFKDYGKLSKQKLEDKKLGARIEKDDLKRNPQDFALWKFLTKDNLNHVMKWESPWGIGFPGWHIECSAMSSKYLGNHFDLHTGGIEHISIHHENEIAQNKCSHDINVNYWLHNDHLMVNSEKMSKSLGNVYYISNFIEKGYNPLAFRELCLRSHYRKNVNFTFESLEAGMKNIKKLNDFYSYLNSFKPNSKKNNIQELYNNRIKDFKEALADDLNTPKALAQVYEFMNDFNKEKELSQKDLDLGIKFMQETNSVLCLLENNEIPKEIIELTKERIVARKNKDWQKSDELRDKIKELGYIIRDSKKSKEGYILDKC